MESSRSPEAAWAMVIHALRPVVAVQVILQIGLLGICILMTTVSAQNGCPQHCIIAATLVTVGSLSRLLVIAGIGFTQAATAASIKASDAVPQQRIWYNRWQSWNKFGSMIMILQVIGAAYLSFLALKRISNSYGGHSRYCASSGGAHTKTLLHNLLVIVPVLAWILVISQCCAGSTILEWRCLYKEHHKAWRVHYHEIFLHGIQELLCCLGKWKYLHSSAEVDSVASVLSEFVSYRASGASHLEFLAGISLLQVHRQKSQLLEKFPDAPDALIREATLLHPYSVAAYTGLLLDFGRNPLGFLFSWFHRQGILTPWNQSRRPMIEGDNWWRGHAAAFLKGSQLPPEALLKGRVYQKHMETVYFVAVVQHLRCIVVTVRGTESPEDLLTDGLCRESILSDADLSGLMNCSTLPESVKRELVKTKPHFAHAGVLEAARELALQLDNVTDGNQLNSEKGDDGSTRSKGFLSSLVGPDGKYKGYVIRFVGHSLGGSIAAVTALLLYIQHPSLHVYTYGVLPCLDLLTAEACSECMTSVVYNDEFSSRLSVASVMRLRDSALQALVTDARTDSTMITQITKQFSCSRKTNEPNSDDLKLQEAPNVSSQRRSRLKYMWKGGLCLCHYTCQCVMHTSKYRSSSPLHDATADALVYRQHEIDSKVHSHPSAKDFDIFQNVTDILKNDKQAGNLLSESATHILNTHVIDDDSTHSNDGGNNLSYGFADISLTRSQGMHAQNPVERLEQLADRGDNDLQSSHMTGDLLSESAIQISHAQAVEDDSNCSNGGDKISSDKFVDRSLTRSLNWEETQGVHTQSPVARLEQMAEMGDNNLQESCLKVMQAACDLDSGRGVDEKFPVELYIPGQVIHIIREERDSKLNSSRRISRTQLRNKSTHRAILRHRESFKDLIISHSMFLDHMPWRCQHALKAVMDQQVSKASPVDLV